MVALSDVTHGTVIGDRYRITEVVADWIAEADDPGTKALADDIILGRRVVLYVIRRPDASELLDAGRRAALLNDDRVPHIFDVGLDGELAYVVTEHQDTFEVTELLRSGPLPAAQVRALVGEVAEALAAADARGLHHTRLTPSSVALDHSGRVHISGIAIDAAASGDEELDADDARHVDALSLVSLLYAALTSYWPGRHGVDGLEPAPVSDRGIQAPADVTSSVPNDLDSLAAAVFSGNDDGPRTPKEVARYVGPWESEAIDALGGRVVRAEYERSRSDGGAAPARPTRSAFPGATQTDAGHGAPAAETPDQPDDSGHGQTDQHGLHMGRRGRTGPAAGRPESDDDLSPEIRDAIAMRGAARFPLSSEEQPAPEEPEKPAEPAPEGPASETPTSETPAESESEPAPKRTAATFPATAAAGSAAAGPPPATPAPAAAGSGASGRFGNRLALIAITAIVVIGLILALTSLSDITGDDETTSAAPTRSATPSATSTPTPSATTSPSPTPTKTKPPVKTTAAQILDPEGDGDEHNDLAGEIIDGKKSTGWHSHTYSSSVFGYLKKGVGFSVTLNRKAKIHKVKLTASPEGGEFEVRASGNGEYSGSKLLAKGTTNDSTTTVKIDHPVKTEHIVIWFTKLPALTSGYRVTVGDLHLS